MSSEPAEKTEQIPENDTEKVKKGMKMVTLDIDEEEERERERHKMLAEKKFGRRTESVAQGIADNIKLAAHRESDASVEVPKMNIARPAMPSSAPAVVLEGYLQKMGEIGIKSYKKRWFSLDSEKGVLSYYKSKPSGEERAGGPPTGKIILEQVDAIFSDKEKANGFCLSVPDIDRVYKLVAEDEDEQQWWMGGLRRVWKFHRY